MARQLSPMARIFRVSLSTTRRDRGTSSKPPRAWAYPQLHTGTGLSGVTNGGGNGVEGLNNAASEQEGGVTGIANLASTVGASCNIYAGTWGDTGTSSTTVAPAWAIGVLGTGRQPRRRLFNNVGMVHHVHPELQHQRPDRPFQNVHGQEPGRRLRHRKRGRHELHRPHQGSGQRRRRRTQGGDLAVQSPENWMEDFGSGELRNGVAVVNIDPAFTETVTGDSSYKVFITPNGDAEALYVINKTAPALRCANRRAGPPR